MKMITKRNKFVMKINFSLLFMQQVVQSESSARRNSGDRIVALPQELDRNSKINNLQEHGERVDE